MKHVIIPPIKKVDITQATSQSTSKVITTVPTQTTATIDKTKYIQIPQHSTVIALEETHKGKDMYDTLEDLAKESLSMPTPGIFMRHWLNVKEAAVDKTRILKYSDGTPVKEEDVQNLWQYLSSDYGGTCWTWLNAQFESNECRRYIKTNLETKIDQSGKYLDGTKSSLILPIQEDCYVTLDFNAQGMPTTKSPLNFYKQGENIYFSPPEDGAVARFHSDHSEAYLEGHGHPHYKDPNLGVFACAQDTGGTTK